MIKMKVVVDSSSNYRKIEGIDYSIVPMFITTKERDFTDDENLNTLEMLDYLENCKIKSGSSCPSVNSWLEAFEGDNEVIAITLASPLSGSNNACNMAANEWRSIENHKIYVLDTMSIGPVEKLCVEFVKENYKKYDFDIITKQLEKYCRDELKIGYCLESLTNLANNGRIKPAVARIAQTLGIHIVGDINKSGELVAKNKIRGKKQGMQKLYGNMKEAGYKGGKVRIDHCFAKETALLLASYIKEDYPHADILVEETTGVCSFYAQRYGVIAGYEIDESYSMAASTTEAISSR